MANVPPTLNEVARVLDYTQWDDLRARLQELDTMTGFTFVTATHDWGRYSSLWDIQTPEPEIPEHLRVSEGL